METPEPEDNWYRASRVWFYHPRTWDPSWWNKAGVPFLGSDEWGRRTIVWGFGFIGYVVWAYRTCWCQECHAAREQTYRLAVRDWNEQQERIRRGQCLCVNLDVYREWSAIKAGEPGTGLALDQPCLDCRHPLRRHDTWGVCEFIKDVDTSMRPMEMDLPENLKRPLLPEDAS